MNVEIVFTGLCSVLNPRNTNPTMPEPSIILVQTKNHPGHDAEGAGTGPRVIPAHSHADGGPLRVQSDIVVIGGNLCEQSEVVVRSEVVIRRNQALGEQIIALPHDDHEAPDQIALPVAGPDLELDHVPFLAFNTDEVQVDDRSDFQPVQNAEHILFLRLEGVELTIENNPPATPTVLESYNNVVRKDDYWPEAKNHWDPAYVPRRGTQPQKSAVTAFMRFGSGTLAAGRISPFTSEFTRLTGEKLIGNFADEVVYAGFPHSDDAVVINIRDLDTRTEIRRLRFTRAARSSSETLTLSIGNHVARDMDDAVRRKAPSTVSHGRHFAFLNAIAGMPGGPTPSPFARSGGGGTGGGGTGGLCGPGHGNG